MSIVELLIIVGLVFIFIELIIGIQAGFDLVLLGSILVISGLLGIWLDNPTIAFLLIIGLSVFYILVGRSLVRKKLTVTHHRSNVDNLAGSVAIVQTSIKPHHIGSVILDGEIWRAKSTASFAVGDKVRVISVEGVTLLVEPLTEL